MRSSRNDSSLIVPSFVGEELVSFSTVTVSVRGNRLKKFRWIATLMMLVLTAGCGVPQVLSPALPESAGTVAVGQKLSQPFLAPSNGLDGVTIAVSPPLTPEGDLLPQPTGGATVAVRYAPEADDRFPEEAFHDWPASDQWLGELTGDHAYGQTFLSRYPGLDGITLRVATFGADAGTGEGTLNPGSPVEALAFPFDGALIATVDGGSRVQVIGTAEGWAQIKLGADKSGYVPLDAFAQLPPPPRHNTHDVTLTLFRESDLHEVRRVTINAAKLHDNSHVTFAFDPIPDSDGRSYRFVLTSPDSTPGDAVTFRYQPKTSYNQGSRYDGSMAVAGALVFRPDFTEGSPIYQANVDTFEWSSLSHAFVGSFSAKSGTADRFLSIELAPGTRPLSVNWSLARPNGGQPVVVDGNSQTPGGGLVFNVRFRGNLAPGTVFSDAGRAVWRDSRDDPGFFVVYTIVVLGLLSWCGWAGLRRVQHGR